MNIMNSLEKSQQIHIFSYETKSQQIHIFSYETKYEKNEKNTSKNKQSIIITNFGLVPSQQKGMYENTQYDTTDERYSSYLGN